MKAPKGLSWLMMVSMVAAPTACGGGDDDTQAQADAGETEVDPLGSGGGGQDPDAAAGASGAGSGGEAGSADSDASIEPSGWCGDGVVQAELGELCDDGNGNELDGCTRMCEFTCQSDEDCSDLDICNGEETCDPDKNLCVDGENPEDGTSCGVQKGCKSGVCVWYLCGDGVVQEDSIDEEECDDGNLNDGDGCTTACQFACVSTDSARDCSGDNECAAASVCNDETHTCEVAGEPPPEKTLCNVQAGWCIKGECVPYECGDGEVTGTEECDKGDHNGEPGSECSLDCEVVRCGNGDIEGDEECDDGGRVNLDGCDSNCGAEVVFRLTRMDVVQGQPPDFCKYYDAEDPTKGNIFGTVFGGEMTMMGGLTLDLLGIVNDYLRDAIASGATNSLVQLLDVEDRTGRTLDDDMRLAIYSGVPTQDWPTADEPPLDFPFNVEARGVDPDRQPISVMPARMYGGGLNITTEPSDVDVTSPMGRFFFRDAMARSLIDVQSSSLPPAPPTYADSVLVPSAFGTGDTSVPEDEYRPEGRLCGAISMESMAEVPMAQTAGVSPVTDFCCKEPNRFGSERYIPCSDEVTLPACSSFLDMVRGGCYIYPARLQAAFEAAMETDEEDPLSVEIHISCDPPTESERVSPMVTATEPDIDTDGDGEPDSYSAVIGFEGNRVKIVGVE